MLVEDINTPVMRLDNFRTINEMAKKAGSGVIDSVQGPITQEELDGWLEEYGIEPDEVSISDGRLNVDLDFDLNDAEDMIKVVPIPLGKIDGDFNGSVQSLQTFTNFPIYVEDGFFCFDTEISSFEGLNITCGGDIDLSLNKKLNNIRGIHKHIRKMNGRLKIDLEYINNGGLGMLLIDGVKQIITGDANIDKILNKHLKKGQVFEAQEQLIDGGYAYLARV